jgi:hypothetical protein
MQEAILNLERMPGYKNKIWGKIENLHTQMEEEKGHRGTLAGLNFQQELKRK